MMRTGGWALPHKAQTPDTSQQVAVSAGVSSDRLRRMAASSITTAMAHPQALQFLLRIQHAKLLAMMQWHTSVPVRHWMARVTPSSDLRVMVLVVTLYPTPSVLMSAQQFLPVFDTTRTDRGHNTAFTVGERLNTVLGLQSEPFVAGQLTYNDHRVVLSAIPIRDTLTLN